MVSDGHQLRVKAPEVLHTEPAAGHLVSLSGLGPGRMRAETTHRSGLHTPPITDCLRVGRASVVAPIFGISRLSQPT